MFLAKTASVKQWGIFFYRESGLEKGPGGVTVSTFLLDTHACSMFSKDSLVSQARTTNY